MFGKLVKFFSGKRFYCVFGFYCPYAAASGYGAREYRETALFGNVAEVEDLHAVSCVGLVAAVAFHSLFVGKARNGSYKVDSENFLEYALHKALAHCKYVLHLDKGHFKVYLSKFGLSVGSEILVAEASCYLHISVKAGNHRKLLVKLWRLRQGIERTFVNAAGNEIVARAFGCALYEHRRFYFDKAVFVKVVACYLCYLVAQKNVAHKVGTAQIKVSVL